MFLNHDLNSSTEWKADRPEAFAALDPDAVTGAIAVLVFHGMGQQAQFETLNDVTNAFIEAHREQGWEIKKREDRWRGCMVDRTVDLFKPRRKADELLPAGQITLAKDGKEQEFDFYEAYWAPLTEGQVNVWECLRFLLRAAIEGMAVSFFKRGFQRVIFGRTEEYRVGFGAGVQLALAGLTVAALAALCGAYVAVIGEQVFEFFNPGQHTMTTCAGQLRELLTRFLITSPIALIPVLLNAAAQKISRDTVSMIARVANLIWILPMLLAIIYFGCSAFLCFATHGDLNLTDYLRMGVMEFRNPTVLGNLIFVLTGGFLLWITRYFGVKYLGDVVAYVSAHAVNRFWDVRERIQERCLRIAKGVYNRKKKDSNELLYEHVAIVSHSLGSVIAYDILNWLVTLEVCGGHPPCVTRVAERTRLFLTCGSPLNKIAFLFRFNIGLSGQKEWRDRLSNYRQPLILNYHLRPHRWINIWSYPDWISGRLSYYEPPKSRASEARDWITTSAQTHLQPRALKIMNIPDPEAFIPLIAHTSYFRNKQFRTALYDGLWSEAASSWDSAAVPVKRKIKSERSKKAMAKAAG